MTQQPATRNARPAAPVDIRTILGHLDDAKVAEILSFKPSLADLEDAAVCMIGTHDVLAKSGHHVPVTAARIIELLTKADEEPKK